MTDPLTGLLNRRALLESLARHAPAAEVRGLAAGFHAVLHLPDTVDEAAVVATARSRGIGLHGMSRYRSIGAARPPALVMGFGHLSEKAIARGIAAIGDLLRAKT